VATLLLALAAVKMANETKRSADSGVWLAQSAEHDSRILERQFRAEHQPWVRVKHNQQGQARIPGESDSFYVDFEHVRGPAAEIVSATFGGDAGQLLLSKVSGDMQAQVSFEDLPDGYWGPLPLEVRYRAETGGEIT